jgi:methylphosphotriester-DNA--protein-cysteine methyltransferase
MAPPAPVSDDKYRDMPCFAHRDASGKCNHTNQNCKFVNDLKADQEAGYKRTRRQRPRGKGKADKERSPRIAATWMKTLRQNPLKRQRVELARATRSRVPRREHFTPSLDLLRLRHREPPCAP